MTAITFQNRVQPWLLACFGAEIAADKAERNHRFLEESLELVQSCGCTASEAHQLVDYVFGRPVGEPAQEAGGVMVTLAALCLANSLDMHEAGETELARIWTKVEAIRAKQAAKPKHSPLPAAPAAVAPQGERQWICPTRTVADLVNNLLTMDQGLPVYGAQYIEKDGRRCAIAVPPTVSRERVLDGRWIGQGEELNAAVVWTRAEQPAAVAGPALDVTLDEDQAGLLRDMLGDPAEYPEAITVRLLVGDGHSGHGLYVAQAEYQDEGAVLLSSLPAPAAPALEAPAAPALPAAYQGGMFATTPDGGTVTLRFSDASAGEQWFERLTDGFDALAAAPQAPRLGEDALHLLRRLLSNQHTLTGPEFRAELEKIVAEESARHAAAPQAPAAPVGDEREAFEAWIKRDGGDLSTFGSGQNRHYNNSAVNNAWTGWSSRAKLAAPAAPAVDASDTALLDAMERERIAVIPEFEGPWDAQIFGEDEGNPGLRQRRDSTQSHRRSPCISRSPQGTRRSPGSSQGASHD
ncbi:hypothetical protein [Delftia sp.]|uniref:hypothetical protein n=1 Tax=Delftia sp. TaxID=1886637 RepID=UPI00259C7CE9|nr:hypothetical protein [Delftia sp.]